MTDKLRESAQQALEAIERACHTAMTQTLKARIPECGEFAGIAQDLDFVINALRAALAQQDAQAVPNEWPAPLGEFKDGQWWIIELDAMARSGTATDNQKRAVSVVHHLLAAVAAAETPAQQPLGWLDRKAVECLQGAELNWMPAWNRPTSSDPVPIFLSPPAQQDAQAIPDVCQGTNCGVADGLDHSPECIVETAEAQGWGDAPEAVAARQSLNAAPTPPAQRGCSSTGHVGLTDEEISRIYTEQTGADIDASPWALHDFARAVIEAYERKNGKEAP